MDRSIRLLFVVSFSLLLLWLSAFYTGIHLFEGKSQTLVWILGCVFNFYNK